MFQFFKRKDEIERKEKLLRFKEQEVQNNSKRASRSLNVALHQNKKFLQNFDAFTSEVEDFRKERLELQDFYTRLKKEEEKLKDRSRMLSDWEDTLRAKEKEQHKESINLHIKTQSVNKQEEQLMQKDADLDEREKKCLEKEKELSDRSAYLDGLVKENEVLKKETEEIKVTLEEKINACDLKMSDMDSVSDTFESIKTDASDDGKKAKIVVKEALRSAIKELEDMKDRFLILDGLYTEGSFKGFAVPLDEIDSTLESLKLNYQAVREHALSTGLDFTRWLECIETCIRESDKALSSYLFAQGYRYAVEGLSYCKGYSEMIEIFNAYASGGAAEENPEEEKGDGEEESDWDECYRFFFEDDYDPETDYDSFSPKKLNKQYKKMAKKYHPDHAPEDRKDEYQAKMAQINKIWDKLKNHLSERNEEAA